MILHTTPMLFYVLVCEVYNLGSIGGMDEREYLRCTGSGELVGRIMLIEGCITGTSSSLHVYLQLLRERRLPRLLKIAVSLGRG